jgi:hypothetical protein
LRHLKTGVHHAERAERPLFQERAQALTGDRLHDQANDVDGKPVVPDGPGLIQQRCGCEPFRERSGIEGGARDFGRGGVEWVHGRCARRR